MLVNQQLAPSTKVFVIFKLTRYGPLTVLEENQVLSRLHFSILDGLWAKHVKTANYVLRSLQQRA
jgi:hypothetical protein